MAHYRIGGKVVSYLGWGLFFIIGFVIKKYQFDCRDKQTGIIISIVMVNLMLLGFYMFSHTGLNQCVKLLIGESLFLLLCIITRDMKKVVVVNFCGKYSLVVYVVHGLTQFVIFFILSKAIKQPVILISLIIAVQIIIAWMVYYFMNHVKVFKWINFIFFPTKYIAKLR